MLELFCLQLNMIGWISQLTSLEHMSCFADHDICNSSVPFMDDGYHGFRAGKQLLICIKSVVHKLFLITYHLWVLWCQNVPPCSRKIKCAKYRLIKSLAIVSTWTKWLREFLLPFSKPTREVHKNSGIYLQNPINKNYGCEYNFSLEKVSLFVYHVESLHVGLPLVVREPQFGNHCIKWTAGKTLTLNTEPLNLDYKPWS